MRPIDFSQVVGRRTKEALAVRDSPTLESMSQLVVVVTLTQREQEVLRLLASGHSAKEVAQTLAITARTVESHIDRVRLKTRTRNRTHMVAHAIQQGWVSVN
jgi:DNA-binding CsgD family transcriptional regulator